jgi:hypothetical protein
MQQVHTEEFMRKRLPLSSVLSLKGGGGLRSAPPLRGGDNGEGDLHGFSYGPIVRGRQAEKSFAAIP